jgi:hypothetical protein
VCKYDIEKLPVRYKNFKVPHSYTLYFEMLSSSIKTCELLRCQNSLIFVGELRIMTGVEHEGSFLRFAYSGYWYG